MGEMPPDLYANSIGIPPKLAPLTKEQHG